MPGNEKRNGVLSILKEVFMGKREDCGDIVYQAEKIVSDYISRRRNEIINKYCKKRNPLLGIGLLGILAVISYIGYIIFI